MVHQPGQQLDRADDHRPGRSPDTTTDQGINDPAGITAGPDGALWFTNDGTGSIGRITTAGVVTNYTAPASTDPDGITAGPDGALWFTNAGNDSIGRITTAGVVTNYTGTGIDDPSGDHRRARRGAVVHQRRQRLDRADHHGRGGDQLHRHRTSIRSARRSPPGPTGRCGSPTTATTRSVGSPRRGGHQLHGGRRLRARRASRPGRTGHCGSPTRATTRSAGSPPPGW